MSPFISGKDLEDRLKSRLKEMGCLIESKEKYDHEFKLDFMVYRLAGFEKPLPISVGVQVTADTDDLAKQREFNYYKRLERFGFIGWDGAPDFWFSRDHVEDPDLLNILDNPDLYVSGTPIVFQNAGITRDGEKRPTAIGIRLNKP